MAGYLYNSSPDYKMAPQNRAQMNGGLSQSKNCYDGRFKVSDSRREDIVTSLGFGGDCFGSSSEAPSGERNATATYRTPSMMFGYTPPPARSQHLSTDSSVTPPSSSLSTSSGRTNHSALFTLTDATMHNAEYYNDQFRSHSLLPEAEPHQRNSRAREYSHQDSEYSEEHRSDNHDRQERKPQDSRLQQSELQDCRLRNPRCQDTELRNQNSRSSYFLNLSAMGCGKNSGQQNETRKLAPTPGRSPASTTTDQGSRGGAAGQVPMSSRSIHRMNVARDDQILHSPMGDAGFVRGGVHRSLQLPKDRQTVSGRFLAGTGPLGSEGSRSSQTRNLINVGKSQYGLEAKSPTAWDGKKKDAYKPSMNEVVTTPWPRVKKATDKGRAQYKEEDEGAEDLFNIKFQEIYGTLGRKSKPNQRNAETSSSMRNDFGSLTQSTSLAQLPQKSLKLHLIRGSVSPMYSRGGEDGGEGNDTVYDSRNNRSYGSTSPMSPMSPMSPVFSSSGRSNTGIPVFVGSTGRPTSAGATRERFVERTSSVPGAKSSNTSQTHAPLIGRTLSNPIAGTTQSKSVSYRKRMTSETDLELSQDGSNRRWNERPGGSARSTVSILTKNNFEPNVHRKSNNRIQNGGQKVALSGEDEQDTDAASELSDTLSIFSINGSTLMVDVLNNLTSSTASVRKDGLSDLQYLLRSGALLSKKDVKRLTEIFTRMFHDPQAKVFSLFMEVLVDLINFLAEDLEEWIPICLSRLLIKVGADLLGSVHIKVQRALETIRNTFSFDLQMSALTRFISEPSQISNPKVKEAILSHLHDLILSMSPTDFSSDDDHQLLWTQLINWSMESKPSYLVKSAQKLIIAVFNLNPPMFSLVLMKQPKPSQDFVRKILHNHLRMASNSIEEDDETQCDTGSTQESRVKFESHSMASHLNSVGRLSQRHRMRASQQLVYNPPSSHKGSVEVNDPKTRQKSRNMYDVSDNTCTQETGLSRRREPKSNDLEKQQLQINRMSEDSGIYFGSDEAKDEFTLDFKNESVFSLEDKEPNYYDVNQNAIISLVINGKEQLDENNWWNETSGKLLVAGKVNPWLDVVETFSDIGASEERRKQAMKQLIRTLPDKYEEIAESSLKTMLGVLLLTSGGTDEVSELAEECISLLLKTQTIMKRIEILKDVVDKSDFPINLAALKLQYSELQSLDLNDIRQILSKVVPSLIRAYENNESRVRKASLLSLVHLHKVIGDDLWQHISKINENKKNLLTMYFRRASPHKFTSISSN